VLELVLGEVADVLGVVLVEADELGDVLVDED